MSEKPISLYFDVSDFDITIGALTSIIGLSPSHAHYAGDKTSSGVSYRKNSWSLQSRVLNTAATLQEHWESLEHLLTKNILQIEIISLRYHVSITVMIDASKNFPPLLIPPAMSKFAGQIGATIDIDIMK